MSAVTRALASLVRRSDRSFGILVAIFVLAASLLGFAEISDEVREGETHAFDQRVMLLFRSVDDPAETNRPSWLEIAAADITSLGSIAVIALVSLVAAGYLLIHRNWSSVVLLVVSVGGGLRLGMWLKTDFDRPRPNLVPHAVEVHTLSFPSSHAMMSAVTYLTLGALLAQSQSDRWHAVYVIAVATTLTLLIGLTRVYLGVHWPTDVLAGWCVGSAWALVCWLAAAAWQRFRPGRIDPPAKPE